MAFSKNIVKNYHYFVLLLFSMIGMFSQYIHVSVLMTICSCFLFLLVIIDRNLRLRINNKSLLVFSFWISVSLFFFLSRYNRNLYSIDKNLKNFFVGTFHFVTCSLLYLAFKDFEFDNNVKKIFIIQLLIQFFYFVKYYQNNTFSLRFFGSFSEPCPLGFYLTISIFIILIVFNTKIRYLISIFLILVLIVFCRAKFAVIAVPLALLFSIFFKIKCANQNIPILISFLFLVLMIFILYIQDFILIFYKEISNFVSFSDTTTYATRFFYLFTSFDKLVNYPIGCGFGTEYEFYGSEFPKFISYISQCDVDTSELALYTNPDVIIEKDTISVCICLFGFFGLFYFFYHFIALRNKMIKKKFLGNCLLFVVLFQTIFAMSIYGTIFIFVIFARMALNKCIH